MSPKSSSPGKPQTVKTTVYLDREQYTALERLAERQLKKPAELIRQAVREYNTRHGGDRLPKSLGLGNSGRSDLSERAEELLIGMGSD